MQNIYVQKIIDKCEPGTEFIGEYTNAKARITLRCSKGHERTTTANSVISKNGNIRCKECLGRAFNGKKSDELVEQELLEHGFTKIGKYLGALTPIEVQNNACGHIYLDVPSKITRGRSKICNICFSSKRTSSNIINEIEELGLELVDTYVNMKTNINVLNKVCRHTYEINPGHLLYDKIGAICKVCSGSNSIKNRFINLISSNSLELLEDYTTTATSILARNTLCNHEYYIIPNNLVNQDSGLICRICNPGTSISKAERTIVDYINSIYDGWIETSDRSILEGQELDIVLPDLGIAIEYNGNRWHSEDFKDKTYHIDKTNLVEAFGYQLIHINETEWMTKADIVKSRLKSLLNKNNRIHARKTVLKEIHWPAQFLEQNHIQGAGSVSKHNYGLFSENELVAVMTFSKPRFNYNYEYELIRYCSKLNYTVTGGASKLLKHFTNTVLPKSIVSYSDKRWSTGKLYKTLGFSFKHTSAPNYRYYKYKTSLSRYQCQKHLLPALVPEFYDPKLSESQIMRNAGYYKVYDCGSDVWVLTQ